MTKTEIRVVPHTITPGAQVVELWHDGEFIGQVVGMDGPGARIITKHSVKVTPHQVPGLPKRFLNYVDVAIDPHVLAQKS